MRQTHSVWIAVALLCLSRMAAGADAGATYTFNIPEQTLADSLRAIGRLATVNILFTPETVEHRTAPAIRGQFTAEQAVGLALAGSKLHFERTAPNSILVEPGANISMTSQGGTAEGSNESSATRNLPRDTNSQRNETPDPTASQSPTAAKYRSAAAAADPDTRADKSSLQEVVVTANRRAESLGKVPISVSAFTQESMDIKGIRDFTDVARFTPGVTIDTDGTNSISIRGISSSGGAGTTGIYIDDTPIQMRAMGVNPDDALPKTFDMERIEVLRGPQGTLFGAGSEGGTVRYIMTQPSLTKASSYVRSEISYTQGGAPSYEAGVAGGAPIVTDTLGFRVSAWIRRDGGWIDRINPTNLQLEDSNTNHDETAVVRAALTWAPTSSVQITPSVLWQDRRRHDVEYYWPLYSNPGHDRFVSGNFMNLAEPDQYWLPALKVSADLPFAQLISDTSYFRRRDISGYDATLYNLSYYQTLGWLPGDGGNASGSSPYAGSQPCAPQGFTCYPLLDGHGVHLPSAVANYRAPNSVTNQQDTVSQELRLQSSDPAARVVWTAGAFFSLIRSFSLEEIHDPMVDELFGYLYGTNIANVFGAATNPDGSSYLPRGDSYLNQLTGHDRQIAGFGEVVWGLTDRLKLTTGLRYSKTSFSFVAYNDGPQNGGPGGGSGSSTQKPLTERVGLSFQQDPNNLYYATYSTGFRVGGANSAIPYSLCASDFVSFGLDGVPSSYKSDTVKSFEIGAKNNLDNRLRLAGSLYYIQWDDIQQNVVLPTCGLGYVANLGKAVSEGGDLQAQLRITDALNLESALGYTDAHYTQGLYPGPLSTTPLAAKGNAILGQSGNPPAPWTLALGLEYRFQPFAGHDAYLRLDAEHQTKNNRRTAAEDPTTVQYGSCTTLSGALANCNITPSGTTFVSLRASSTFADWELSAFVDNLFDSHPVLQYNYQPIDGYGPQPAPSPIYRNFTFRPRTIGLTLIHRQ